MSTTMDIAAAKRPPLEVEAEAFADATANPPYLYDLGPAQGREVVNQTQAGEIAKPAVTDEWIKVPCGPSGEVPVRIVRPARTTGTLPVILYIHGAM
jgi:acetyl esterase